MASFWTRGGRCVVEHGEICLESLGLRGRLERRYENVKLTHERRYERSLLRFGLVFVMGIYGIGQILYAGLFGDKWLALLGVAIVGGILAVVYSYFLTRRLIRRWF